MPEPEYETCMRCTGVGRLTIKLGRPNPQRNNHEPYGGPWCVYPEQRCPVCLGSGQRKVRKPYTPRGEFHVHSTKADNMSFDEIFDAMNLERKEGTNGEQVQAQ